MNDKSITEISSDRLQEPPHLRMQRPTADPGDGEGIVYQSRLPNEERKGAGRAARGTMRRVPLGAGKPEAD